MVPVPHSDEQSSPVRNRRALLVTVGTIGGTWLAGCLSTSGPSSGGPAYEDIEIDDGPVFGPGLQDETEQNYYAALVVTEEEAGRFDFERLSGAETEFVTETDFGESYLGVVQVSALNTSMRFDVVDLHESDVNLTVNVAVRDDTPHSDDRVITTLLLRVTRGGERVPNAIAVELDVGGHHETFSGSRP